VRTNKTRGGAGIPARIFGSLWVPAAAALALLILACPSGPEDGSAGEKVLDTRLFWAQDFNTRQYYRTTADLLAEGRYCKIWVEQTAKGRAGSATARDIADAYDTLIYPRMIEVFSIGPILDSSGAVVAGNTLELADWMTDRDGKLNILFLDIRDASAEGTNYVGGYFWMGNFYKPNPAVDWSQYSNSVDMIYIDTDPGRPGETESFMTLAHEMQHLMNFVTSSLTRKNAGGFYLMDTWIDEGLSSAAEYIYLGLYDKKRYGWFNDDLQGTIAKGNNFFVWGNYQGNSLLDDYATVYLFFQWLRIQSESEGIYKRIIRSENYDYRAVTRAADTVMPGAGYADWGTLLKTWLAANYINASSGPYGYRGEPGLSSVRAKTVPGNSLDLLPGEGVYSLTQTGGELSSYASGSGSHIKYAGLNKATGELNDAQAFAGGWLLTYNANTDIEGRKETGRLSGTAASVQARALGGGDASRSRSAAQGAGEGPVRIDARDMLARRGLSGEGVFGRSALPLGFNAAAGEAYEED
jgi:hypothetical protein